MSPFTEGTLHLVLLQSELTSLMALTSLTITTTLLPQPWLQHYFSLCSFPLEIVSAGFLPTALVIFYIDMPKGNHL